MDDILKLIGRAEGLFDRDIEHASADLSAAVSQGSFLVIGGAGTIGQAVTREIFKRSPRRLHVVDISENNLVELVRDIRSSLGYIEGDFQTLPLDCSGVEFGAFVRSQQPYDYILNLSALKHVRSEKDPYTLMRMVAVNVLNMDRSLRHAIESGCRKYFGVSTDKAVRPANAMGATKSIMEMCLMRAADEMPVSTARFANVAFSDGSLLHGFLQRIRKMQPLSAPRDVQRYFIVPAESGQLCLMSCLLGRNRDLLFPKIAPGRLDPIRFDTIAVRVLESLGYEAHPCQSEDEARQRVAELAARKRWPCYFFDSDTTGEKDCEEFYGPDETVDLERFDGIGVVAGRPFDRQDALDGFLAEIRAMRKAGQWTREGILDALRAAVAGFEHRETHKYLDGRM